jgi:hypothetical protein
MGGQDRGLRSRYRNLHDAHVQAELTINDRTEVPDSPAMRGGDEGFSLHQPQLDIRMAPQPARGRSMTPEERRAYANAWRAEHREHSRAYHKRWRDKHRKQRNAANKRWHDANRDRVNEARRQRRLARKESKPVPE